MDNNPIIELDGTKRWYQNERLHRLDGPAVIDAKNREAWYQNGKLHRIGGPAFIGEGIEEWWFEGDSHRMDGPAYITSDEERWYVHDEDITNEVLEWVSENNIPPWEFWGPHEILLFRLRF